MDLATRCARVKFLATFAACGETFATSVQVEDALHRIYGATADEEAFNYVCDGVRDPYILSCARMAPSLVEELRKEKAQDDLATSIIRAKKDAVARRVAVKNDLIRCRCGSTDVLLVEKQTRSADEAATLFCYCVACKSKWRG